MMIPLQALTKAEAFLEKDPHGVMMAITAMAVVFSALALLWLLFALVGKAMSAATRLADEAEARHKALAAKNKQGDLITTAAPKAFAGEAEIAAIALALSQFQSELHDQQATVLTINRVARAYSPWSSKIYGLRQTPNKK